MTKTSKKILSLITLLCFVFSQSVDAYPGMGIEMRASRETPSFFQIQIPSDLATVDGIFEAPARPDPRMILHVQNAHANYDAQQKIKQLLEYLEKTYAIKTIFVEGASEDLNPDYLKFFPDAERNRKLADYLARQGELTGAEMFLLESGAGVRSAERDNGVGARDPLPVRAHGIERAELYRENYEALKKVFGSEAVVSKYLEGFEVRLDKLASNVFLPDLRKILREWKKFENGHREFIPYVKDLVADANRFLGEDLESLFAQVEWPQISRLLVLQMMEKNLDAEKGISEKERVVRFLKEKRVSQNLITGIETFQDQRVTMPLGESAGGTVQPRDLMEQLVMEAGPKGFLFHDYPYFSLYAGYLILKSELDPKGLFDEIGLLFRKILDELAKTDQQKALLDLYRDEELVRKLLNLELTRKNWEEVLARKARLEPEVLVDRLKELGATKEQKRSAWDEDHGTAGKKRAPEPVSRSKKFREIIDIQNAAYAFYDAARRREEVFYEKIDETMRERRISKAVLVTGGFHTDGITELLREHEISYGILTPRLSEKSDEHLYRSLMLQNQPSTFELSYLEATSRLISFVGQTKQMNREQVLRNLKPVLKAIGYSGSFKNVRQVIEAFNHSSFSADAGIQIDPEPVRKKGDKPVYRVVLSGTFATKDQILGVIQRLATELPKPTDNPAALASIAKLAPALAQAGTRTGDVVKTGEVRPPDDKDAEKTVQRIVVAHAKAAGVPTAEYAAALVREFDSHSEMGNENHTFDVTRPALRVEARAETRVAEFTYRELLKGFMTMLRSHQRPVHVRGIWPGGGVDPNPNIRNYIQTLRLNRRQKVIPDVIRVYLPITTVEGQLVTGSGRYEDSMVPKSEELLPADVWHALRQASEDGLFELVELGDRAAYDNAARELGVPEQSFFETMVSNNRVLFVSEWVEGTTLDAVLGNTQNPDMHREVGRNLGRVLRELHQNGILVDDNNIDQYIVTPEGQVLRLDLEKIYGEGAPQEGFEAQYSFFADALRQDYPVFSKSFVEGYGENLRANRSEQRSRIDQVRGKLNGMIGIGGWDSIINAVSKEEVERHLKSLNDGQMPYIGEHIDPRLLDIHEKIEILAMREGLSFHEAHKLAREFEQLFRDWLLGPRRGATAALIWPSGEETVIYRMRDMPGDHDILELVVNRKGKLYIRRSAWRRDKTTGEWGWQYADFMDHLIQLVGSRIKEDPRFENYQRIYENLMVTVALEKKWGSAVEELEFISSYPYSKLIEIGKKYGIDWTEEEWFPFAADVLFAEADVGQFMPPVKLAIDRAQGEAMRKKGSVPSPAQRPAPILKAMTFDGRTVEVPSSRSESRADTRADAVRSESRASQPDESIYDGMSDLQKEIFNIWKKFADPALNRIQDAQPVIEVMRAIVDAIREIGEEEFYRELEKTKKHLAKALESVDDYVALWGGPHTSRRWVGLQILEGIKPPKLVTYFEPDKYYFELRIREIAFAADTIVIADDASYSGKQIRETMEFILKVNPNAKFIIAVPFMSDTAVRKIKSKGTLSQKPSVKILPHNKILTVKEILNQKNILTQKEFSTPEGVFRSNPGVFGINPDRLLTQSVTLLWYKVSNAVSFYATIVAIVQSVKDVTPPYQEEDSDYYRKETEEYRGFVFGSRPESRQPTGMLAGKPKAESRQEQARSEVRASQPDESIYDGMSESAEEILDKWMGIKSVASALSRIQGAQRVRVIEVMRKIVGARRVIGKKEFEQELEKTKKHLAKALEPEESKVRHVVLFRGPHTSPRWVWSQIREGIRSLKGETYFEPYEDYFEKGGLIRKIAFSADTFVIADDASYSGEQIRETMEFILKVKPKAKFIIAVPFMTDYAVRKIKSKGTLSQKPSVEILPHKKILILQDILTDNEQKIFSQYSNADIFGKEFVGGKERNLLTTTVTLLWYKIPDGWSFYGLLSQAIQLVRLAQHAQPVIPPYRRQNSKYFSDEEKEYKAFLQKSRSEARVGEETTAPDRAGLGVGLEYCRVHEKALRAEGLDLRESPLSKGSVEGRDFYDFAARFNTMEEAAKRLADIFIGINRSEEFPDLRLEDPGYWKRYLEWIAGAEEKSRQQLYKIVAEREYRSLRSHPVFWDSYRDHQGALAQEGLQIKETGEVVLTFRGAEKMTATEKAYWISRLFNKHNILGGKFADRSSQRGFGGSVVSRDVLAWVRYFNRQHGYAGVPHGTRRFWEIWRPRDIKEREYFLIESLGSLTPSYPAPFSKEADEAIREAEAGKIKEPIKRKSRVGSPIILSGPPEVATVITTSPASDFLAPGTVLDPQGKPIVPRAPPSGERKISVGIWLAIASGWIVAITLAAILFYSQPPQSVSIADSGYHVEFPAEGVLESPHAFDREQLLESERDEGELPIHISSWVEELSENPSPVSPVIGGPSSFLVYLTYPLKTLTKPSDRPFTRQGVDTHVMRIFTGELGEPSILNVKGGALPAGFLPLYISPGFTADGSRQSSQPIVMESGQPRDSGEVRFEEVEIIPASFNGKRIPVPDRWVVTDFKVNGQTATAGQYLDFGTWGITVQPNGIVSTSGSSPHAGTKVEATVREGEGLAKTLNPPGSNEVDDARVAREIIDIPKEIRGELDNIRARFENGGLTRKDVAGAVHELTKQYGRYYLDHKQASLDRDETWSNYFRRAITDNGYIVANCDDLATLERIWLLYTGLPPEDVNFVSGILTDPKSPHSRFIGDPTQPHSDKTLHATLRIATPDSDSPEIIHEATRGVGVVEENQYEITKSSDLRDHVRDAQEAIRAYESGDRNPQSWDIGLTDLADALLGEDLSPGQRTTVAKIIAENYLYALGKTGHRPANELSGRILFETANILLREGEELSAELKASLNEIREKIVDRIKEKVSEETPLSSVLKDPGMANAYNLFFNECQADLSADLDSLWSLAMSRVDPWTELSGDAKTAMGALSEDAEGVDSFRVRVLKSFATGEPVNASDTLEALGREDVSNSVKAELGEKLRTTTETEEGMVALLEAWARLDPNSDRPGEKQLHIETGLINSFNPVITLETPCVTITGLVDMAKSMSPPNRYRFLGKDPRLAALAAYMTGENIPQNGQELGGYLATQLAKTLSSEAYAYLADPSRPLEGPPVLRFFGILSGEGNEIRGTIHGNASLDNLLKKLLNVEKVGIPELRFLRETIRKKEPDTETQPSARQEVRTFHSESRAEIRAKQLELFEDVTLGARTLTIGVAQLAKYLEAGILARQGDGRVDLGHRADSKMRGAVGAVNSGFAVRRQEFSVGGKTFSAGELLIQILDGNIEFVDDRDPGDIYDRAPGGHFAFRGEKRSEVRVVKEVSSKTYQLDIDDTKEGVGAFVHEFGNFLTSSGILANMELWGYQLNPESKLAKFCSTLQDIMENYNEDPLGNLSEVVNDLYKIFHEASWKGLENELGALKEPVEADFTIEYLKHTLQLQEYFYWFLASHLVGVEEIPGKTLWLKETLESVVSISDALRGKVEISEEPQGTGQKIELTTDGAALAQVLLNLLRNAQRAVEVKFGKNSPEKGKIRVRIRRVGGSHPRILVTVWDNGVGMSSDVQKKIFSESVTTKETQEGHGFGLMVVAERVKNRLGGRIRFRSKEGEGTVFMLQLPVDINHPLENISEGTRPDQRSEEREMDAPPLVEVLPGAESPESGSKKRAEVRAVLGPILKVGEGERIGYAPEFIEGLEKSGFNNDPFYARVLSAALAGKIIRQGGITAEDSASILKALMTAGSKKTGDWVGEVKKILELEDKLGLFAELHRIKKGASLTGVITEGLLQECRALLTANGQQRISLLIAADTSDKEALNVAAQEMVKREMEWADGEGLDFSGRFEIVIVNAGMLGPELQNFSNRQRGTLQKVLKGRQSELKDVADFFVISIGEDMFPSLQGSLDTISGATIVRPDEVERNPELFGASRFAGVQASTDKVAGGAELLDGRTDLFTPVDRHLRYYRFVVDGLRGLASQLFQAVESLRRIAVAA